MTWNIDTEGKLTVEGTGEFSNISEWNRAPWYGCRSDIKSAEINLTGLNNATGMFYGCNSLTTIDVHGFDTSTVTNMDCMFCGCTKLESVDLCGFDTVKVTSMARMFQNCRNLTSLDVSSFNTQNVGNMSYMFQGCSGLTGLDLSKFDTQSVTSMSHMFKDCSSLTSIDLSNFNTQNVRDMSSMFQGCSGLTSVDLSELDTQNVMDMSYMFQNCSSLISFDLKKIDMQSVCDMSYMFQNCSGLFAAMTVSGIDDYAGTKRIKFKITGKAFSAKQISVENLQPVVTYTGKAVTQDNVVLKMSGRELVCGKDYTVTYKNNLKKGTASMIFKAVEESGYSGSFTKKFRIGAAELKDTVKVIPADPSGDSIVYDDFGIKFLGTVLYSKEGAKISDRVLLTNGSNTLKEGIDYTVSYVNNKVVTTGTSSISAMNIKGKGNYSGNLSVQFVITEAPMEENEKLAVVAIATSYNAGKEDSYQYQPKIKVMDGKKLLSVQKDYIIEYRNCTQSAVKAYLEALEKGTSTGDMKPQAVIWAKTKIILYMPSTLCYTS